MMAKKVREGDGTLPDGTPRIKIVVITKENGFADCSFERLDDRIELEPIDMQRTRRALKKGYRDFKRERMEAVEAEKEAASRKGDEGKEEGVPESKEEGLPASPVTEDEVVEEANDEVV
jgi:hypothetical protein